MAVQGFRLKRLLVRLLVASVTVGLVFSAAPAVVPAVAAPTEPAPPGPVEPVAGWVEPTGEGLVRPDLVSAAVTARASGSRVEVLAERSATSRTWALPSGALESEASSAPVRFREEAAEDDGWRDIDTTLVVQGDGSIAPRAVPEEVTLAGAGDSADELIQTVVGDRSLTLGAGVGVPLPAPVLEGSTATYVDVLPDVDVKVEVRPTGFEQLWVAKTRAGLDRLLTEQAGGDQGVTAALSLEEVTAAPQASGGVTFTDADKTVAKLNPPTVWDAASTPNGQPLNEEAASFDVVDQGDPLPPKTGATGELELSVVPDQDWLADPARVFPVTIDPTYVSVSATPIFDTWVQTDETVDKSGSTTLPAGMDGGGIKSRSFLNFDTTPLLRKSILSASLALWGSETGTCTANGWSAYDSGLASTSTRWTAQPALGAKYATSTQTKGWNASCPDGPVSIDMKAQTQAWADDTTTTTKGMVLKSDNENSYTYYHRFNSSEATANQPVLRYTYNRLPATMAVPTIAGTVAYTPAGASQPILYTADTRPNVSGVVSDPDGNTVRGKFYSQSTEAPGGTLMSYCTNGLQVASGTTTSCEMDTDIDSNTSVWIKARAIDALDLHGNFGKPVELRVATGVPRPR